MFLSGSPDATTCLCGLHRYAEVMKQDVLKQAVQRVVQSVIAALAAAVAEASPTQGSELTGKLVLPTLAILLEWWALHPAYST